MDLDAKCEQIFKNIILEDEKIDKQVVKQLSVVFTGMQGRYTRFRIICELQTCPMNSNQLAKMLGIDYTTVQHNLKALLENNLIEKIGSGYGDLYFLSEFLLAKLPELSKVIERVHTRLSFNKKYI